MNRKGRSRKTCYYFKVARKIFSSKFISSGGYVNFILLGLLVLAILFAFGSAQINQPNTSGNNSNSGNNGNRPQIADFITRHLAQDSSGWFNKLRPNPITYSVSSYLIKQRPPNPPGMVDSADPDGYYFCTDLTIDTFNISGINLSQDLTWTDNMISYWKSKPGFHFIDYWSAKNSGSQQLEKAALLQVKPGDAIWFHSLNSLYCGDFNQYCHTGMVYSVNINSNGDGYIETREANNTVTVNRLAVSSWYIVNFADAASFGGVN